MHLQDYSARKFQLWEYRVSHGSLLIRSPQDADVMTNVDVICTGVEYIAAPRLFDGLAVLEPFLSEVRHLEGILNRHLTTKSIRVLASSGHRYVIVAASLKVEENRKDIFENPFD